MGLLGHTFVRSERAPGQGRRRPIAVRLADLALLGAIALASNVQADPAHPAVVAPPKKPAAPAVAPPAATPVAPPATAAPTAVPTAAPTTSSTVAPVIPGRLTLDGLRLRVEERQRTIDQRRQAEKDRIRLRWGALVSVPAVHDELKAHAERTALLERIEELGQVEGKTNEVARAVRALTRENARHERQMQALAMTANAAPATGAQP
jgi:hypothetical protein